jgi:glycine cleavage system H protein
MENPQDLKYTDSHEWARREPDGTVAVGITHFAQDKLGDMVYIEPPKIDARLKKGDACAVLESVKAASDLYAPVSGAVVAVNDDVNDAPEAINKDPYGSWLFKLKPDDPAEIESLLSAEQYESIVASEE